MPEVEVAAKRPRLGRIVSLSIIAAALVTGLLVIGETNRNPRTDDAEVFANFIGIAPQVDGPIQQLAVRDNAFIKQGELLFEIDSRPYEYALQRAKSDFNVLEGQIVDQRRTIASQVSAVGAAEANTMSAAANIDRAAAAVNEAKANVANAKAGLDSASAELLYTTNNFHRIEPLLAKQFVTVDQVDQARTAVTAREQAVHQQRSQVVLAEAQVQSAEAQYEQARAAAQQSHAQLNQSQHSVLTIDPLTAQREGRASAIRTAAYNLNNCKVYAPFDARVTNLTISQGAYAHTGQQVFTLIDTRTWWAVANFRETQIRHIVPGMHADVYILSRPTIKYDGVVDSVGFGVQPDTTLVGTFSSNGLPDVQRSLNWVHLATRYPVRVRINAPESEPFRVSESAVVIIRGDGKTR
ncbi:Secretion protein, HlyD family [Acidisarcina polymorpha]|uniref:Secretion protein, HlyD family n=1 Tax=Acidisarcina polymorpha TaxID=2211140 RepID=A0A2Z5G2B4_9BACT|nr:biotin/lipoyl-binding protein [Acidisarcina polymorpha]AXC12805.1 Secretion protein, HlyD family [Acidisarcina polymorpha]